MRLSALAYVGLLTVVNTADAADMLHGPMGHQQGAPVERTSRQYLPPLSSPQPFRQTLQGSCGTVDNPNTCVIAVSARITDDQLLQIDSLSCYSSAGSGLNIFSNAKLDFDHIVAAVPGSNSAYTYMSGPLYFLAGDRPSIVGNGGSGQSMTCWMTATLWHAG